MTKKPPSAELLKIERYWSDTNSGTNFNPKFYQNENNTNNHSTEAIRRAELIGTSSETSQEEPRPDYIITLKNDSIKVIDPDNGKTILTEKYDSKSPLVKAILKDNE